MKLILSALGLSGIGAWVAGGLLAAVLGTFVWGKFDHWSMERKVSAAEDARDTARRERDDYKGRLVNAEIDVSVQKDNVRQLEAAVADQNLRIQDLQAGGNCGDG